MLPLSHHPVLETVLELSPEVGSRFSVDTESVSLDKLLAGCLAWLDTGIVCLKARSPDLERVGKTHLWAPDEEADPQLVKFAAWFSESDSTDDAPLPEVLEGTFNVDLAAPDWQLARDTHAPSPEFLVVAFELLLGSLEPVQDSAEFLACALVFAHESTENAFALGLLQQVLLLELLEFSILVFGTPKRNPHRHMAIVDSRHSLGEGLVLFAWEGAAVPYQTLLNLATS